MKSSPKVSVYIPTYNYGRYLKKAIDSVLAQTYQDFELIIIDDASRDNTLQILKKYEDNSKIKIIKNKNNLGFVKSAIKAIKMAEGEYIMRVDADDYLDENALLVMVNILEKHPEIGMVYPDYFHIDKEGNIIDHFRRKKIGREIKLFDLPAMGACTLMRKSCYQAIGGYRSDIRMQDKYDLWLKFIKRFKIYNVNLPLFYYRRHQENISNNTKKILRARRYIKEKFIEKEYQKRKPRILGIIPTRATHAVFPDLPTKSLAGKPLIYYPLKAMKEVSLIQKKVFVSEDEKLLKKASKYGIDTLLRPKKLAKFGTGIEPTVKYVLKKVEKKEGFFPEIVVILFITSPLITSEHIKEAIDTLIIYNADSVISVKEDRKFHHRHGKYGLQPLFKTRLLTFEKDLLFEETGSLIVTGRDFITNKKLLGKKISHIILSEDEAVDIESKFHFWLAEQIIKNKKTVEKLNN